MNRAVLYFDGGIRQGICAYGWLLVEADCESATIDFGNKTCGKGTSNIAEYRALIAGLYGAIKNKIRDIVIKGDSQLVVRQVSGIYQVKNVELAKHQKKVLELLEDFDSYTLEWIPRKENKRADALVGEVFSKRFNKCKKKKK